ncbi:MAG TPA: glycosyltransferase 87 family protein [Thermoleophilaceae bacterium]|jgi:hypothetical protein
MPSIAPRARAAAVAVALLLTGLIAFGAPMGVDYLAPPCDPYVCDDAGPSIAALAEGDLDEFFAEQPPMGSFSFAVRGPFVAAGDALGASPLTIYRLGAFACLLGLMLLTLHVGLTMYRRGREWKVAALVPLGVLASPVTYAALEYGHPEELLGAALVVGAVLAAARDRTVAAALLLGAAVATKQWAVMAALPVLLAAPRNRVRITVLSLAAFAVLTIPMMLGDWDQFWLAQHSIGVALPFDGTVTASNVWFPFADSSTGPTLTENGVEIQTQYSLAKWLGDLTHPLVALLALGATAAYFLRRRTAAPEEVLQLVALIFLLRCVLDPLTYSYHHAPFVAALVAYEGLRRRVPVMSGVAIAALLLTTHVIAPMKDAELVNAFYLGWALPMLAALVLGVFFPARLDALAARLTPRRVRTRTAASQTAPLP